jgi:FkbM family methyltransferase
VHDVRERHVVMSRRPSPRAAVLRARDLVAAGLAGAASRSRIAEAGFAAISRSLHGRWHAYDSLHRVTRDTLLERWGDQAVFRRVRLGPVELWGDVNHFSFGTVYFQRGGYESQTVEVFASALQPGGTVVDVGANRGFFTALSAVLVGPSGRVEAFEPNPAVARRLEETLLRNSVSERVTVHERALSDRAGMADFFVSVSPVNDGLSSLLASDSAIEHGVIRRDTSIPVLLETFDAFAERVGLGRVDLVKIDVEGAEDGVVRGMEATLRANPPRLIVCETVPESVAAGTLRSHGYAMRALEVQPSGSGNYLFTASNG